jgi:pyridine nucleotide-disulfide oxidoreductase family protein
VSAQLLLIGGGHAHLGVLDFLTKRQRSGIDVTLVSTHASQVYSGMLPGHIAGHYSLAECSIPLDPVAERAHADFIRARVVGLDLAERVALTEDGGVLPFDVVSIDIGPAPERALVPGLEHVVSVRPIDRLLGTWDTLEKRYAGTPLSQTLAVIGGGPAGTEVVAALAYRARNADVQLKMSIVAGSPGLLPELPKAARTMMRRRLNALGVRVIEADAEALRANAVSIRGAGEFHADVIIAALGAAAYPWPRESGLKCDDRGFIEVNRHLQSVSHPFVFAAGDCASMAGQPHRPGGVYAVRAGPHLAENLLRMLTRRRLVTHRQPKRTLHLISAGGADAVGAWGPLVFDGPWVWRWKDRIDRKFIRRFNPRV